MKHLKALARSSRWERMRLPGVSHGAASLLAAGLLLVPAASHGQSTQPPPPSSGSQPAANSKPQAAKPAPEENAFPEAESEAAAKDANAGEKAASDGPAATPSEDAPESSSRSGMKGLDLLGDNDSRISNGAGGVVEDPKLAKEDIRVGQLYMGEEDYAGAYSRFKEATLVGPGNPDAVFFLAEAARKSAHLDEAAKNYQIYLDADPKGKRAKDARKALAELAGK